MHSDGYFDKRVAATYDDDVDSFSPEAVEPVVDFLAELAGGGSALEFGIGTGRIALPLAMKGVEVHGIDLSNAVLTKLAEKTGGDRIPVTQGDFATASCKGSLSTGQKLQRLEELGLIRRMWVEDKTAQMVKA